MGFDEPVRREIVVEPPERTPAPPEPDRGPRRVPITPDPQREPEKVPVRVK